MNRRKFLGGAAATAAAFTIVPRHVLGGAGHVAPSEKINICLIGCGTMGLGHPAVSLRLGGKRLVWDATAGRITNLESANKNLTREYRKGWELSV